MAFCRSRHVNRGRGSLSRVRALHSEAKGANGSGRTRRVGIVVVDHGSKRKAANELLGRAAVMLEDALVKAEGAVGECVVEPAHMELAEPSIDDAIERLAKVEPKVDFVVVAPFFLAPGRYVCIERSMQEREKRKKIHTFRLSTHSALSLSVCVRVCVCVCAVFGGAHARSHICTSTYEADRDTHTR